MSLYDIKPAIFTTNHHRIPPDSNHFPLPASGGFFLTNQGVAVKLDNVTNQIVLVNDIEVFWVGVDLDVLGVFLPAKACFGRKLCKCKMVWGWRLRV